VRRSRVGGAPLALWVKAVRERSLMVHADGDNYSDESEPLRRGGTHRVRRYRVITPPLYMEPLTAKPSMSIPNS
jgi:hypothetical protein